MACWPRELKELALLVRSPEPDSTNLGDYLASNAEALAPFLNATPANLRSAAYLRDEDVAPKLRHRLEGIGRRAEDERRARLADRAARAAATLGATARWTEQGAVLDVDLLLRDALADRTKKYIAFKGAPNIDVAVRRNVLAQVAGLRRIHIDLVAFADADGLHFRWKGGRGGYNWRSQVVLPADADRVLTVHLRPARTAAARSDRGAWLGDVLRELGFSA
jgi:hypothetical protein